MLVIGKIERDRVKVRESCMRDRERGGVREWYER